MAVFINSPVQKQIYNYLEQVGPSPLPALEVVFGTKTLKHLYRLRAAGFVYDVNPNNITFWAVQGWGHFPPAKQEVHAWFAARLVAAGGRLEGDVAYSPTGVQLMLSPQRDKMLVMQGNRRFVAELQDLKDKPMRKCLKHHQS